MRGGRRHHEPCATTSQTTARSRLALRESRRQEVGFDDNAGGRSSVDERSGDGLNSLCTRIFIFQTSTENCEEHFVFWNGEGELTGRSGNQSTFEGAVTEWAKTLRLSRTAAAGRHTKARDQRAHHHESSRHRIFFWIFDEAVPF